MYLTATLPPKNKAEFFEVIGLKEGEVHTFRDSTTRKNISYSVVDYVKDEEDKEVKRIIDKKKAVYPLLGKIVVYYKTVKQTQRLATVLGCSAFYREVGSEREKSAILRELVEGKE